MQYIAPCCHQNKLLRILADDTHNPSGLWKDGSFYNYICLNCGKLFYIEDGYKDMTIQEQIKELKTKLEQQNKEMLNKIAELQKQAKAEEQKQRRVFIPGVDEQYWYLTSRGWDSDECDYDDGIINEFTEETMIRGNCFKTEDEAKWEDQHRIVATELKNFVQENDTRPITEEDWGDNCLKKYYICYDYDKEEIFISGTTSTKIATQVYASDVMIFVNAIHHIGEERLKKYYFGVKE